MRLLCASTLLAVALAEYDGEKFDGSLTRELAHSPCVRLFHSTGDVGCRGTPRGGAKFALLPAADLLEAGSRAREVFDAPLTVVLEASDLNASVTEALEATARIGALLVLGDRAPPKFARGAFSPDVRTPQGNGTPQARFDVAPGHVWNRHGNGLAGARLEYAVTMLTEPSDADAARAAARANAASRLSAYPRWFASFDMYFGPHDMDSVRCLGWRDYDGVQDPQCLPLGGQSTWATAGGPPNGRALVLASAALDSAALFHEHALGANDAAASIAALLAAADALGSCRAELARLPRQLVFALFQGDEFGFLGSRRFARDLAESAAPARERAGAIWPGGCENEIAGDRTASGLPLCLAPTVYPNLAFRALSRDAGAGIDLVVALDQIGLRSAAQPHGAALFLHASDAAGAAATAAATMEAAASAIPSLDATRARDGAASTPPSPLTPFVRAMRDAATGAQAATRSAAAPGVVVAGYDDAFADPRYHSMYDNASHISADAVRTTATFLARALFRLAAKESDDDGAGETADAEAIVPAVNASLVDELLECLTRSWRCALMRRHVTAELDLIADAAGWQASGGGAALSIDELDWGAEPPSYYTSVIASWSGLPLAARGNRAARARTEDRSWDEERDHAYTLPSSPLELFARSFLASRLGAPRTSDADAAYHPCNRAADCAGAPRDCSVAGVAHNVSRECAGGNEADEGVTRGACVCPGAFYHVALDPGLEASASLDVFEVRNASAPLYAEPNWDSLSVTLYPAASDDVGWVALMVGACVALVSWGVAHMIGSSLLI